MTKIFFKKKFEKATFIKKNRRTENRPDKNTSQCIQRILKGIAQPTIFLSHFPNLTRKSIVKQWTEWFMFFSVLQLRIKITEGGLTSIKGIQNGLSKKKSRQTTKIQTSLSKPKTCYRNVGKTVKIQHDQGNTPWIHWTNT